MKRLKWRFMIASTDDRLQRKLQRLSIAVHDLAQKYDLTYIDICTIETNKDPCMMYRAAREKGNIADAYAFDRRSIQHD